MSEKNTVLLTALSTFQWDAEKKEYRPYVNSVYHFKEKDGTDTCVNGLYQLDPLVNLLKHKNILLDKVILLATEKTQKAATLLAEDYAKDEEISPEDYFKLHLQNSMKEKLTDGDNCFSILIDENAPSNAINQAATLLQKWSEVCTIELYVDTHGGFRSNALIMEAIIDLIADDNIKPHIFNVRFGEEQKNIVEDEAIKIFDFVSGINEFTNYGRIDSLNRFEGMESCEALLKPIRDISKGIQWCDLPSFELGLRQLKNYFKKKKNPIDNPYLQIFENKIRLDYGALLEMSKEDDFDAVNAIHWCMQKGFFQQAITIAEARIEKSLLSKGLVQLTEEGKNLVSEGYSTNTIWNGCIFLYALSVKWWGIDDANKKTRKFFNEIFGKEDEEYSKINDKIVNDVLLPNVGKKYKNNDGTINWEKLILTSCNCSIMEAGVKENVIKYNVESEEKLVLLGLFLFMHKTIKDIRNQFNHAHSENPYRLDSVKKAVQYYLWLIQKLE